nr:unnamed protein product [Digitaria exilis]
MGFHALRKLPQVGHRLEKARHCAGIRHQPVFQHAPNNAKCFPVAPPDSTVFHVAKLGTGPDFAMRPASSSASSTSPSRAQQASTAFHATAAASVVSSTRVAAATSAFSAYMPARNPGTSGCAPMCPALAACACTARPSRSAPARPHAWSTRAHAYPSAGTPRACISTNTATASHHSSASASMATCLFHSTASLPSSAPAASASSRRLDGPRPSRARRSTSAHATCGSRARPERTASECSCGASRRATGTHPASSSLRRSSAHCRRRDTRRGPSRKESTPRSATERELDLRR